MNDEDDKHFDEWEEEEDDECIVKSLFSEESFNNLDGLIAYDKATFGFDLRATIQGIGEDNVMELIMLVNFIRSKVHQRTKVEQGVCDSAFIADLTAEVAAKAFSADEANMRPFNAEDQLLILIQEVSAIEDDDEAVAASASAAAGAGAQIQELQTTIGRYQELISNLASDSTPAAPNDGYYFDGYSHLSIHETMLRDHPRTSTYAAAFTANPSFMAGKTVLDVGCGTGILCLLAAKAGAKKVIGVDLSSMAERAKVVVAKNGYSDVITIVRGRLESVELPVEAGEVDIIVSEWMGYGLYYENMLASVFFARDTYLRPDGVMMPNRALIYMEALTAKGSNDRVGWWKDVYGFDMTDLTDLLYVDAQVQLADPEDLISNRSLVHSLDTKTACDEDLDFESPFQLVISVAGSDLSAFVLSFDVDFDHPAFTNSFVLSTGVEAEPTHWKQTVLWLNPALRSTNLAVGDSITGAVTYLRQANNARDYKISVRWTVHSATQPASDSGEKSQAFMLVS